MIAGVCLLVVLTIAECRINLGITPSLKQFDDCGDVNDGSSKLGQCAEAADDYDYDDFCDSGCAEVVEEYFDCLGISNLYDYIIDELEETCDDGTDSTTPAVTVCAISTVTAILVAIAAALN